MLLIIILISVVLLFTIGVTIYLNNSSKRVITTEKLTDDVSILFDSNVIIDDEII